MKRRPRAILCLLTLLLQACGMLEVSVDRTPTPDVAATGTVGALQAENAALATRLAELGQFTAIAPTDQPAATASAVPPTPSATRITFLSDATVGVVNAPIQAGQTETYVLDAFVGQPMYAFVGSPDNDVTLSIHADTGATILSEADKTAHWQGSLPRTGDYYLAVHGGANSENFSLTVTIPLRLQFPQGADSATLSGRTVAGYDVSYTVFASKGQTMSVNLEEMSSKASLSIYGFTDGQSYIHSDAGQRSYQFVLPATQDYIVVVVPFGRNVVRYTITVHIK